MSKKKILIFIPHYLPGYKAGGPIRSISNLVSRLGDKFHFKIVTTNRDLKENKTYNTVIANQWNTVEKAEVFYCSESNLKITTISKLLRKTDYDIVYLNTFFGIQFSLLPLIILFSIQKFSGEKILLAPRGQLSDGALSQSVLKKKFFLKFVRIIGMHKKIKWQATNELEKKEIIENIGVSDDKVFVVSNLTQKFEEQYLQKVTKKKGELNVVFLSRIDIKKNIDYALNRLSEVIDIQINFHIYGSVDNNEYWSQCKKEIEKLPNNVKVCYKGYIEHKDVIPTIAKYHLFFLPTKGENFGHAIFEALLAGTPVLISNKTPWLNLYESKLGWEFPLSQKCKFIEVIKLLGNMSEKNMNRLKKNVYESIRKHSFDETLKSTITMFESF